MDFKGHITRERHDTVKTDETFVSFSSGSSPPSNDSPILYGNSQLVDLRASPERHSPVRQHEAQPSTSQSVILLKPTGKTTQPTSTQAVDKPVRTSNTPPLKLVFRRGDLKKDDMEKKLKAMPKDLQKKGYSNEKIQAEIEKQRNDYYPEFSLYKIEKDGNTISPLPGTDDPQMVITELVAKHKGETSAQHKHLEVHGLRRTTPSSLLSHEDHKNIPKIIDKSYISFQFNANTGISPKDLPKEKNYKFVTLKFKTTASRASNLLQKVSHMFEFDQNTQEKTFPGTHPFYAICNEEDKQLFIFSEENEDTTPLIKHLAALSPKPEELFQI